MLRVFLNWFHRSPIRMGLVNHGRSRRTRLRNAQFISFMSEGNRVAGRDSDRYDARLRRQRLTRSLVTALAIAGFAWFVLESVKAVSLF